MDPDGFVWGLIGAAGPKSLHSVTFESDTFTVAVARFGNLEEGLRPSRRPQKIGKSARVRLYLELRPSSDAAASRGADSAPSPARRLTPMRPPPARAHAALVADGGLRLRYEAQKREARTREAIGQRARVEAARRADDERA